MVDDSDHQFLAVALAVGFATVSLLASALTLLLIRRVAKWNGYIQLVVSLTACQVIYDISFFFLPITDAWGEYLYLCLNTFGGLTSSLWSNVIILVTARIVIRLRTVDTLKRYRIYFACVIIPSAAISISSIIFFRHDSYEDYVIICYFAVRSASIVLNLAAISLIFLKISLMHKPSSTESKTTNVAEDTGNNDGNHDSNSHVPRALSDARKSVGDESPASRSTHQNILNVRKESSSHSNSSLILNHPPPHQSSPPNQSNPVFVLSKRLVYYCIVQTITRIGSSWYQLAYGFGNDYEESEASTLKTIIYLSEFVLNPSAGIGYLIVFLLIQPEARMELRYMLGLSSDNKNPSKKNKKYSKQGANGLIIGDARVTETSYRSDESKLNSHHSDAALSSAYSYRSDKYFEDPDEDYDALADTSATISSNDSSMFPLLDNMTEDDLAREIERRYNPHYQSINNTPPLDGPRTPLINSMGNGAVDNRYRKNW